MSQKHAVTTFDFASVFFTGVFIALVVAMIYQGRLLDSAEHRREIQRKARIASEPVRISRVQMQGVEQEIMSCRLAEIALFKKWHTRSSAEKLILDSEQHCIDKMVRKIAIVDADAAAALAYVMVEGPFNASEEVQAIARDDPQALKAVASLLAR